MYVLEILYCAYAVCGVCTRQFDIKPKIRQPCDLFQKEMTFYISRINIRVVAPVLSTFGDRSMSRNFRVSLFYMRMKSVYSWFTQ